MNGFITGHFKVDNQKLYFLVSTKQQIGLSQNIINKLFKLKKIQLWESGICFIFKVWKLTVIFNFVEMFNSNNINELWKMM